MMASGLMIALGGFHARQAQKTLLSRMAIALQCAGLTKSGVVAALALRHGEASDA